MIPLDWSANPAVVPPSVPKLVISIQDPISYVWYYIKELDNYQATGMLEMTVQPRNACKFDSMPKGLIARLVTTGYKVAIELYEVPHE